MMIDRLTQTRILKESWKQKVLFEAHRQNLQELHQNQIKAIPECSYHRPKITTMYPQIILLLVVSILQNRFFHRNPIHFHHDLAPLVDHNRYQNQNRNHRHQRKNCWNLIYTCKYFWINQRKTWWNVNHFWINQREKKMISYSFLIKIDEKKMKS